MDSFLDLFDPGSSPPANCDVWPEDDDATQMAPEPQMGNVEYKLKLISPSKLRFEHLVTQVSENALGLHLLVSRARRFSLAVS